MFVLNKLLVYNCFWAGDLILISGCEIGFWCLCLKKLHSAFKFQSFKLCWANAYGDMEKNYSFVKMGFSFQIW